LKKFISWAFFERLTDGISIQVVVNAGNLV
jgi:hypothetical protein